VAAFFDLLEKGRHETASFSDEEAAAKRIERFVMDDREFFCKRHRAEFPTFMKVLEAMPVDQFAYRPHERSPSALDLVWTLANEMAACTTMIDSGEVRWDPPPAPLPREALRVFHANYEALEERVNRLGEEVWRRPSKLYVGGDLLMEQPLGGFLWYLFFDAIHHRGQLSTYIRPMGGKVPSIYGPSGDDPGS
jgi:uncharacterized damage-inducible protein DinB